MTSLSLSLNIYFFKKSFQYRDRDVYNSSYESATAIWYHTWPQIMYLTSDDFFQKLVIMYLTMNYLFKRDLSNDDVFPQEVPCKTVMVILFMA